MKSEAILMMSKRGVRKLLLEAEEMGTLFYVDQIPPRLLPVLIRKTEKNDLIDLAYRISGQNDKITK